MVHRAANIEALYDLKCRLMTVKHAVGPLLEGMSDLSGARVPAMCAGLREYFRDVYDHLLRLNQSIESIRDTIATAISVNLSTVSLQENETMNHEAPRRLRGAGCGANDDCRHLRHEFPAHAGARLEVRLWLNDHSDGGHRWLPLLQAAKGEVVVTEVSPTSG